jgi:hypothetical protein
MKRYLTGDMWTDAKLLHAEEEKAAARAFTARRALVRDFRGPRRGARVWLGSLLLAADHRLRLGPSLGRPGDSRRDAPGRDARRQLGEL